MGAAATVRSSASLVVEPLVLRRAMWPRLMTDRGPSFRPIPGTWYAHIEKHGYGASVVLPIVSCSKCTKIFFLVHTAPASEAFTRMTGAAVPVTHRISPIGEVRVLRGKEAEGDVECPHCGLHRHLYLDQWNRLRPLYCTAYVREGTVAPVLFMYSHASTAKEARFHMGAVRHQVIAVGRAVGFLFDEKKRTFQAEATSRLVTRGDG